RAPTGCAAVPVLRPAAGAVDDGTGVAGRAFSVPAPGRPSVDAVAVPTSDTPGLRPTIDSRARDRAVEPVAGDGTGFRGAAGAEAAAGGALAVVGVRAPVARPVAGVDG